METVAKFRYVLLIAGILLLLMIIRMAGTGAWKGEAGKTAEMVETGTCFLDITSPEGSGEKLLLLRIGDSGKDSLIQTLHLSQTRMDFTDLKNYKKRKELKASGRRLVIAASSRQEGMKAWIILHQLGIKNLFILSGPNGNDEELKYQFRPDSAFRPEPETGEN